MTQRQRKVTRSIRASRIKTRRILTLKKSATRRSINKRFHYYLPTQKKLNGRYKRWWQRKKPRHEFLPNYGDLVAEKGEDTVLEIIDNFLHAKDAVEKLLSPGQLLTFSVDGGLIKKSKVKNMPP